MMHREDAEMFQRWAVAQALHERGICLSTADDLETVRAMAAAQKCRWPWPAGWTAQSRHRPMLRPDLDRKLRAILARLRELPEVPLP